jgi:hypothetical protein
MTDLTHALFMKPISLIISTLILSQGLCSIVNVNAMNITKDNSSASAKKFTAAFKYTRPKTADNGKPFPKKSGYIKGYPIQFQNGYSHLTVNNSKGSSDVFVKLYAVDAIPPQPVRVFFIRKGEKFTAEKIKAGNYDIRYRNLDNGGLFRTENLNFEEYKTFDGPSNFTTMSLTLYTVPNGKMKIKPLSEQEF